MLCMLCTQRTLTIEKGQLLPRRNVLAREKGHPRQQGAAVPHRHKFQVAAVAAAAAGRGSGRMAVS